MGLRKPQQQQNHVVELISRESVEENHSSLQQSILRLMNAMASVKSGRDYLGMKIQSTFGRQSLKAVF